MKKIKKMKKMLHLRQHNSMNNRDIKQFLTPHELTADERAQLEGIFLYEVMLDVDMSDTLWRTMQKSYGNITEEFARVYWYDYFRWYTWLTWDHTSVVSEQVFLNLLLNYQLVSAAGLGFDIWQKVMWYMASYYYREYQSEQLRAFYQKVQQYVKKSLAPWGNRQNISLSTSGKVFVQLQLLTQQKDTMGIAQLYTQLQDYLVEPGMSGLWDTYMRVSREEAVDQVVSFLQFFIGVDSDHIYYVVDLFLHPANYGEIDLRVNKKLKVQEFAANVQSQSVQSQSVQSPQSVTGNTKVANKMVSITTIEKKKPLLSIGQSSQLQTPPLQQTKPLEEKTTSLTVVQIKQLVDARFSKDSSGQYENIKGVLALLDSLTEQYKDPHIRDMYYFNEQIKKFEWEH